MSYKTAAADQKPAATEIQAMMVNHVGGTDATMTHTLLANRHREEEDRPGRGSLRTSIKPARRRRKACHRSHRKHTYRRWITTAARRWDASSRQRSSSLSTSR